VAQPIFGSKLIHNSNCGKTHPKHFGEICHLQKVPRVNNRSMGENWPNLVTLFSSAYSARFGASSCQQMTAAKNDSTFGTHSQRGGKNAFRSKKSLNFHFFKLRSIAARENATVAPKDDILHLLDYKLFKFTLY
jgi:hypothetical protein